MESTSLSALHPRNPGGVHGPSQTNSSKRLSPTKDPSLLALLNKTLSQNPEAASDLISPIEAGSFLKSVNSSLTAKARAAAARQQQRSGNRKLKQSGRRGKAAREYEGMKLIPLSAVYHSE